MSSVNVDRDCDIVNVAIEQQGKSEMSVFFRKPFLENRSYVCAVSGLSVPMVATHMLQTGAMGELFSIYRRNAGQDIGDHNQIDLHGAGLVNGTQTSPATRDPVNGMLQASVGTFHARGLPVHNLSDFMILLNGFAAVFERKIATVGITPLHYGATAIAGNGDSIPVEAAATVPAADPVRMLRFGLTPSGILLLTMSPLFCNHFFIEISSMGQALLGFENSIIAANQNQAPPNMGVIRRFGEGLTTLLGGVEIIQPATVTLEIPVYAKVPLLSLLESRLSVHLETDLPIKKTIVSENQVESSVYDLASFVIRTESTSSIDFDGTSMENAFTFRTQTHGAQLVLQSRSKQPTQYSQLLNIHDLRTLRLRLYLKVREYNDTLKKWELKKKEFPMDPDSDWWSCDLRFITTE